MKAAIPDDQILALIRGLYTSFLTPRFILRQILAIRRPADVAFLFRAGLRVLGHLLDFHGQKRRSMP